MRAHLALLLAALVSGCVASPTAPAAPAVEGEYHLAQANGVAMPGSLSFGDGVSFTYYPGTHLRLQPGHRYRMVLDYVARDENGTTPWVWEMEGDYEIRGDTLVLDPRGGDWNGQRVRLGEGGRLVFQFGDAGRRVREMVFRQGE